MASRPRVLVALPEPGYFRLYGSTIVELGREGWDVLLAFDRPDKRGAAQVPADAGSGVRSIGAPPEHAPGRMSALRAAVDYLRYLEAPFQHAGYLRRRSEKTLPSGFRWLTRVTRLPRAVVGGALRAMRLLESLVPADSGLVAWIRHAAPDVVFLSPLVTLGPSGDRQTELMKAARTAGVPVVVGVASWDHLTSKGLVRLVPDALLVWNEAQAREATVLHRVPRSCVVVTGAQSLDHWFEPVRPESTAAFRARLGIDEGRPVLLFVGSSRNMAPEHSEVEFVRRWVAAVRGSRAPELRRALILVRPHPTNVEPWAGGPLGPDRLDLVVHPTAYSGIPLSDAEIDTFRQSLLVSTAVVGINTTAMIEAAILERPVLTVRDPAFVHSQGETLHFGHLSIETGGCAMVARDLDEHVVQLEQILRDGREAVAAERRFVRRFVRPLGANEPATTHVCAAIGQVAARMRGRQSAGQASPSGDAMAHPEPPR